MKSVKCEHCGSRLNLENTGDSTSGNDHSITMPCPSCGRVLEVAHEGQQVNVVNYEMPIREIPPLD